MGSGVALKELVVVGKGLQFINCSGIFADDSVDVVMLDINHGLQQFDARSNQSLKTSNYRIVAKMLFR